MANVSINKIYNRLSGASTYHPVSATTFSDWSMEAGDMVTISRDGTSYKSPVNSYTMKWNGTQEISLNTEGSEKRDAISKLSAQSYSSSAGGSSGVRGVKAAETHIHESEDKVITSVNNLEDKLGTRLTQTDRTISLGVGKLDYNKTVTVKTKDDLNKIKKPDAKTLYYVSSTKEYYVYIPSTKSFYLATKYDDGTVNYIQLGEIAAGFNEQTGQVEAKLDADVVYAGKNAQGKLVSLADLELPDWMGATNEGIVALQGNFGKLNTRLLNAEKIVANAITTDNFSALQSLVSKGTFTSIDTENLYIRPVAGMGRLNVANGFNAASIKLDSKTNKYTLTLVRFNGTKQDINFSRATTLRGTWGSRKFTVTATPQNQKISTTIVSSIPQSDITWWGDGYTGYATLKAVIGDSENAVNVGNVSFNAHQAYQNGYNSGYPVSSNQVSGEVTGMVAKSAGTGPISGRRYLGTYTKPSASSYMLMNIYVHGSTILGYVELN